MRYLPLLLLAACAAAPLAVPEPPEIIRSGLGSSLLDDLDAPSAMGLLDSIGVLAPTAGLVRILHGNTACQPKGGVNPYVHLPSRMPCAGEEFTVLFVTRHGGNGPDVPAWLMMAHRPIEAPVPFGPYGLPGCQLLVQPDASILCVPGEWRSGLLSRNRGQIRFTWTPPAWTVGTSLFMQLLVSAPGDNKGGFLVSPGVEVIVGSPR